MATSTTKVESRALPTWYPTQVFGQFMLPSSHFDLNSQEEKTFISENRALQAQDSERSVDFFFPNYSNVSRC